MASKLSFKIRSIFEWITITLCAKFLCKDLITGSKIHKIPHLEKIGTNYGGWISPMDLIKKQSTCYCVGVGEDTSFDLGIIRLFGCQVYAFDPMPRAKLHVQKYARHLNMQFCPGQNCMFKNMPGI